MSKIRRALSSEEKMALCIINIFITCYFNNSMVWDSKALPIIRRKSLLEKRICPQADLDRDLDLSKCEIFKLAEAIEEDFKFYLPWDEYAKWGTINDVLLSMVSHCEEIAGGKLAS